MEKIFDLPLEEVVRSRHSVRSYLGRPLSDGDKEKISRYFTTLSNPFGGAVSFRLLSLAGEPNAKKLGTYGMIRGATDFIGVTAAPVEMALEAVGYEFETLILYAASLGLGTCWLGGTFRRSAFAEALDVKEGDLFPAVSPVGYPAEKRSLPEQMVRKSVKADQRRPWGDLFFRENFGVPLSESDAGDYASALELVRLGPSASNKQPWRVVRSGQTYHFFEQKEPGYSDRLGFDIQRVDLGIAACHFGLAAQERDLKGGFRILPVQLDGTPEHAKYCSSWIPEEQAVPG